MSLLKKALDYTVNAINAELNHLLPLIEGSENYLIEAMRYSTLEGGKRLRPFFVLQTSNLFHIPEEIAMRVAVAVEMVHCYSLIHDDLPAMDNDDLRRGRLTCHKKFNEATAILAGNALLIKAFEIIAKPCTHPDPNVRCELILELTIASGEHGMVGGQMLDMMINKLNDQTITMLQNMKTGCLINFSCEAGAILGKAPCKLRQSLRAYAHDLGLAFQITDDLLDIEGNQQGVGKKLRKDTNACKSTFVSLLGANHARSQAETLSKQAINHLDCFDNSADLLREVANFIITRKL
ncbi:MAG: polyprenyl synthetase family protein [Rhodospirillaceae bacterium]|jgi:farnesyl diphosphate synthase|nr:polyprenyl synthetase family protein [Rhodospirillaceae bacterium]